MARLGGGRSVPSEPTTCFSQWKLNQEAAPPIAKPAAQLQPPAANATTDPAAARTAVILVIRPTTRRYAASSEAAIAAIPRELPVELHETGHRSQDQKRDCQEFGSEEPVQPISDRIPDERADGQQQA